MFNWVQQFINADRQTKVFVSMIITYAAILFLSTAFAFIRLDFVKNHPAQPSNQEASRSK